jgi:cation diffusion facilitator family transporter
MMSDSQKKRRVALASIAASVLLAFAKLIAGLASGSLALLSAAGDSLLDTGMTTLTYFAIRSAGKPADEEHHYGHGKIESVAALIQTGLLMALAVVVLVEAVQRLGAHPKPVETTWPVFAVLGVSILVDSVRFVTLDRLAKMTRSEALAADALNFSSDLLASTIALIGLVAAHYGYDQGDSVAAIGVSLFIAIAGFRLGRRTVNTLIDTAPEGLSMRVQEVARGVPGVIGIDMLRLRSAGDHVQGELSIAVPRTMPLEKATKVTDSVANALADAMPELAVTVTANPRALDSETVLERVLLAAARQHVPIHHVTVQQIDDGKSVSFDAELDGRMRLGAAHEIASRLESSIRAELGPEIEVESHIEPLEMHELAGTDAGERLTGDIAAGLARRAAEVGIVGEIHDVRVRETPAGLVVNYHCSVDPDLSVNEVHAEVDSLDRKVRADFAAIARIVGHAEPRPGAA